MKSTGVATLTSSVAVVVRAQVDERCPWAASTRGRHLAFALDLYAGLLPPLLVQPRASKPYASNARGPGCGYEMRKITVYHVLYTCTGSFKLVPARTCVPHTRVDEERKDQRGCTDNQPIFRVCVLDP